MLEDLDFAMPIHPRTGLCAIGLRRNGEPIWPVLGAAPDDDEDDTGTDDAADDQGDDTDNEDKPLGPAGEKALEAEKAKRKAATEARRAADKALVEAKAEIERLKAKPGSSDVDEARQQAVADAIANAKKDADSTANKRIIKSELKAAATGKLANPKIALQLIDLDQFEVDNDGNVDEDELNDAIAELLKKEPYLAAQGRRFQGDPDAGPRGKGAEGKPVQVTESELKEMSAEQIVKAQKEGRLADLLGG